MRSQRGLTLVETITALVALVVVIAIAIPLWNTHQLRSRRAHVMDALFAIQAAQDRHFGEHARYAPLEALGLAANTHAVSVQVELAPDSLGYVAAAHTRTAGGRPDARCAELKMDQHGRRWAISADGEDSTADCWNRK